MVAEVVVMVCGGGEGGAELQSERERFFFVKSADSNEEDEVQKIWFYRKT